MKTPPVAIKLPPGFFRNGTNYEASGRFYDGNLVRWENGKIKPWGGWAPLFQGGVTLSGIARGGLTWRANNGYRYAAFGTNTKLYIGAEGSYSDVTPSDLVAGRQDEISGPGYGAGPYGQETFGTERANNAVVLDAATWSMDTYGEEWLGVLNSDGRILYYDPSTSSSVVQWPNSPTGCQAVMVTNEDFIMAIGSGGNGRQVQWPDLNTPTNWTPSGTSLAGDLILKTNGQLKCGKLFGTQSILFTTTEPHALSYVGGEEVYGVDPIGNRCGIVSANAAVEIENALVWMAPNGFYSYTGLVFPIPCDVQDYIFGSQDNNPNLNFSQASKIWAGPNKAKYEVTWFYPSAASAEIDSYVTMNYRNWPNVFWYFGKLPRTVWLDADVFDYPIAIDPSGNVWAQEIGYLANGQARTDIFIQSGMTELGNGDRMLYCDGIIPDGDLPTSLQLSVTGYRFPGDASPMSFGPFPLNPAAQSNSGEGFAPARFCGRGMAFNYQQITGQDGAWTIGKNRILVGQGGKR